MDIITQKKVDEYDSFSPHIIWWHLLFVSCFMKIFLTVLNLSYRADKIFTGKKFKGAYFRKQEGHDVSGLLTWAKIGHESDGFSGIRDAN